MIEKAQQRAVAQAILSARIGTQYNLAVQNAVSAALHRLGNVQIDMGFIKGLGRATFNAYTTNGGIAQPRQWALCWKAAWEV